MTKARPRPTLDGEKVRCPSPGDGHELKGCGSFDVNGPDSEGLYDCYECGIWFDEQNARAAIKTAKGDRHQCSHCGAWGPIVNACGCDPDNLPTPTAKGDA